VWPPGATSKMRMAKFGAPSRAVTASWMVQSFAPSISTFSEGIWFKLATFMAPGSIAALAADLNDFSRASIIAAMKSYRKELWFNLPTRRGFVNITPEVEASLRDSGIKEGLVLCNAMHISASVFINDNESGLHQDFERWLEKLAPEKPYSQYAHNVGEDNADAHLKRTIMGREVVVAVTDGKLDFGPWEQIFYGEFDGKRRKRVLIKIIGE